VTRSSSETNAVLVMSIRYRTVKVAAKRSLE